MPNAPEHIQDHRFLLVAPSGISAQLSSRGAGLVALNVPDRMGRFADVVLGFDTAQEYATNSQFYFGSTIGRVANRIRGASFMLGDQTYRLAANDRSNHLHGGAARSFDKLDWAAETKHSDLGPSVAFSCTSPHLEEGYPGLLDTVVTYTLTVQDELRIDYEARSDRATPVNLTHHSYWNLSGGGAGTILDHELEVQADTYTAIDDQMIPTGAVESVDGTALDFRKPRAIGSRISELESTGGRGYDHNYVLSGTRTQPAFAARLTDPASGRVVEVWTTRPCLQVYSGNLMTPTRGKLGAHYGVRSGICLEPQGYPDALHHPHFESVVLDPGKLFRARTVFRLTSR
ncbi:MAG: galactose mutarotase [Candidatus Dormibacteraceae bacterium]